MISLLVDKYVPEDISILIDEKGIDELIDFLEYIKKSKDHMHLTVGSEIDSFPISEDLKGKMFFAKHVRLEYQATEKWLKK